MQVMVIDIGGNHVKLLVTGQHIMREFASGSSMTANEMVCGVLKAADGWKYKAVSIGYPGVVLCGKPISEPRNLGAGWVGFNFEAALACPVKLINDAAMQALGSYQGGKMLGRLIAALEPDDVVIGGGNVHKLRELPPACRLGDNANAFTGGFRLWEKIAKWRGSTCTNSPRHRNEKRAADRKQT